MALFKIFKGNDTEKLTDANATGYRVPTDGYAYYDTSSKLFYIDAAYGNDDTVITREAINANQALNGVFFGTCSTAQSTKAKVATLVNGNGFRLEKGVVIAIQFTNASAASTMTLSVDGSTAKNLVLYGTSAMSSGTTTTGWRAGAIVPFVYDGTNWVRFFWENSTYYYTSAYCTTAAATQAKAGTSSATQTLNGSRYFQLWIQNTNTYAGAITLNMNSLGAKPIYINGQPSSSTNYNLLRGCYIVYYDATGNNGNGCYHFRTDEKIPGNLAGNADTATYATTAGSVDNETDPIFSASAAADITSSDISNWNSKGTVTKVTAGTGLSIGSTAGGNFTTSGTINHTNSVTAQGTQALYPIKIDAQGHISAYGTAVTSLPASDVYAWAKAATKPTYAWNEISQTGADSIQEGTSDFTDNTEIFSSYASNNGFADTNAAGQVYRRDAVKMYNYIKNKLAVTNNNISVSWNTETTIATIGGTAIKIKIPANPSVLESVTASGTAPLTLSAGTITNKSIAISGSIADATKNAKGVVKIGDGISVSNGTISVTAENLGLSSAMHFLGISSSTITDGGTETPTIGGNTVSTLAAGDVVIYSNKEFVYTSGNVWELLGPDGSYKVIQTAVESATDEATTATRFVYSVTQNTNGEITVKTRPLPTYNNYSLPTASTSTKGGIKVGSGLTMSSETLNHSNSVTAQSTQAVYPIKIDAQGHISAYGTSPTTLAGYGITDAKIASGTITLGSNTITPLTASSTLDATKLSGTIPATCYTNTTYTFDGTYNSSTNKAATVSTVTNAINNLDVSNISGFGAGKTLATLTEADGKIAATFQDISITTSQISDMPTVPTIQIVRW